MPRKKSAKKGCFGRLAQFGAATVGLLFLCGMLTQLLPETEPSEDSTPAALSVAESPTSNKTDPIPAPLRQVDLPTPTALADMPQDERALRSVAETLTEANNPAKPVEGVAPKPENALGQASRVVDIVDGDTIAVVIEGREYRVRYILMNTPERGEYLFSEATEANRAMVGGQIVYLRRDVSETDRYGRLLRYVYLADGTFVNAELVRRGYAQLATFPPDVSEEATIRAAQREAREAGRGLWADAAGVEAAVSEWPTATPVPQPSGPVANTGANLRGGPGTNWPIVGGVAAGDAVAVVAANGAGDWYQLAGGAWIYGELVNDAPGGLPVVEVVQPVSVEVPPTSAPTAAPVVQDAPVALQAVGTASVVIQSVFYDGGVYRVESDEYAVIANTGSAPQNLGGWRLYAGDNGQDFYFPSFELAPGQACRVYTNEHHPESCGFSFGIGKAIWNNEGDCGTLFDAGGGEVARYCY